MLSSIATWRSSFSVAIKYQTKAIIKRYALAEMLATSGSAIGAIVGLGVGQDPLHRYATAAVGATIGENLGFYSFATARAWREAWRENSQHRGLKHLIRTAGQSIINFTAEYAVAEAVDLLARPSLIFAGLWLFGQGGPRLVDHLSPYGTPTALATLFTIIGFIAAKYTADAWFYFLAHHSHRLTKRFTKRLRTATQSQVSLDEPPRTDATAPYQQYDTPCVIMDLDAIRTRYQAFMQAFEQLGLSDVRLHYAMKCNPGQPILQTIHQLGGRFEIASLAELRELQALGVKPSTVLFSNPVKLPSHIAEAHRAGVRWFAADGEDELAKLARHAPGSNVYIRLETRSHDSVVPSEGKFGVTPERALELLLATRKLHLKAKGLAFHVGSQMTNPAAWANAIADSGQVMDGALAHGLRLQMLDLGGGFPAHYADATVPPLDDYAAAIADAIARLPYRPSRLVIEPGRGLVADAGVLVTTVVGVTSRANGRWLTLDTGVFGALMEALESGNTLAGGNKLAFPVTDSLGADKLDTYHLTGPTCDSQDLLMSHVALSQNLQTGDKLFLHTAGAYGPNTYGSDFNGFPRATMIYQSQQAPDTQSQARVPQPQSLRTTIQEANT